MKYKKLDIMNIKKGDFARAHHKGVFTKWYKVQSVNIQKKRVYFENGNVSIGNVSIDNVEKYDGDVNLISQFLGYVTIDINETEFKNYTKENWIIFWLKNNLEKANNTYDAQRLMEQLKAIYLGKVPTVVIAKWSNGTEILRVFLKIGYKTFVDVKIMKEGYKVNEEGLIIK